jgi:hypothetical protein
MRTARCTGNTAAMWRYTAAMWKGAASAAPLPRYGFKTTLIAPSSFFWKIS